jgi:hypothetical protein
MKRANLALLAVLGILVASALATASEPAQQKKTEGVQEKFYVYGGGCSRSIRLQGTYEAIGDACAAAAKYRAEGLKWVSVRTGEHDRDHFGFGATEYSVYVRACKAGWQLQATIANADDAKAMADQLKRGFSNVEIVLHYAKAASAPVTAKEPAPQVKAAAPKEKFYVYGRGCKSIRLQGTYETLKDACAAAAKFRSEGMDAVSVRTGAHDGTAASQYMVYERSQKCGNWFLCATVDSTRKARVIAGELAKDRPVEIVHHYASQ